MASSRTHHESAGTAVPPAEEEEEVEVGQETQPKKTAAATRRLLRFRGAAALGKYGLFCAPHVHCAAISIRCRSNGRLISMRASVAVLWCTIAAVRAGVLQVGVGTECAGADETVHDYQSLNECEALCRKESDVR